MTPKRLQRYRAIGALMEAYADDRRPDQVEGICNAVMAVGETVESARLVARFDYQNGDAVTISEKGSSS